MSVLKILFTLWSTAVFTVFMLLFLPFILIPPFFGKRAVALTYIFLKIWSWFISRLMIIRYHIYGAEKLTKKMACIYVANHTSFLDLPGLSLTIPGQFRPLAKKELLNIPIFGLVVAAATIVVNRSDPESRSRSLKKLTSTIQSGIPALIFPEGTQNRGTQMLQPFKDGAFKIALETGAPIIPITIKGARELMPPGKFSIWPGAVQIQVGDAISAEQYKGYSVEELKKLTFDKMLGMLLSMPAH